MSDRRHPPGPRPDDAAEGGFQHTWHRAESHRHGTADAGAGHGSAGRRTDRDHGRLCRNVALLRQTADPSGFGTSIACDLQLSCVRSCATEPSREPPTCIRSRHVYVPGGVLPREPFCHMPCTAYSGGVNESPFSSGAYRASHQMPGHADYRGTLLGVGSAGSGWASISRARCSNAGMRAFTTSWS